MAKDEQQRRAETERKVEIATAFLEDAIQARMRAGTWGRVSVVAVVEGGYVKEVVLDDSTVVRDLPQQKLKSTQARLTGDHPAA